ncbi:MAG TPA: M14 metallopeptidase family protein, partial [Flavitalea sp.]|nr:M14 metallopeptidase family protein [Flavitalea sp.]
MRKLVLLINLLVMYCDLCSQVSSPEQFLGYKLGSRYTPHYRIVDYFRHVAGQSSDKVKLEQYGETNEGRPLLLAFISSTENVSNLENIRQNNLRLAGTSLDKMAANENAPAIVWLSYNVHGNETSSSEAAMLTLYELVNPANARTKDWLKNTVILIDPCVNPDGRDRYVNWFNSMVGKTPNPQPFSREHSEYWPGGRANHYYFDLNRDWAWQTQVESQQRIVKYNQWLPHVHVDYHEQGINEPYYFAPAAEPFHEVITPWQRQFQTMIGRNNAKYFDQNGWLYFTKERFDLFYPSYGDTYPTYKGAIGMTYEQGGGPRGGAAVINEDGDTLTLWDRLYHHYTTGMSTIEITSQNAGKVVQEFHRYFNKARTAPGGEFKGYLVKAGNGEKAKKLRLLLDRNQIQYGFSTGEGTITGLNYFTGKNESVKPSSGDLVINTNQPNSNLIQVLFERNSKLSDSNTYDITAWAIPYAYGLTTYGTINYINASGTKEPTETNPVLLPNAYAYLVKWDGVNSARFLSEMLKQGIKMRYAEQAFTVKGEEFEKGTLMITRTSNQSVSNIESIVKQSAIVAG